MTEPRTYTYTSPDHRVVVVTRVPTVVQYGLDESVIGEWHFARVSRVLNKAVRAAVETTEPDTVTHLKWSDLSPKGETQPAELSEG